MSKLLTIWSILNVDIVNPQTSKLFYCLNSSEMTAWDQSGGGVVGVEYSRENCQNKRGGKKKVSKERSFAWLKMNH